MTRIFKRTRRGVTLVELMVATVIISIGVLGMTGAFRYINLGIQAPKGRSLANNLAQEKIEVLKNKSYFRVMVTTSTALDHNFDPAAYEYDAYPNGSETLNVGGINFTRRIWIRKVSEDSDGDLTYVNWNLPDTGLKEILVYVTWVEGGSWKKVELRNLRSNPDRTNLGAMFTGTVVSAASGNPPIQGVIVRAQENPARYAVTDSAGAYGFSIEAGSYTLQASRTGYFPAVSPLYSVSTTQNHAFTLTAMSSGTVSGTAWLRDHIVISQVVGATVNAGGFCQEYVELYNPTTYYIQMAAGMNISLVELKMQNYGAAGPTTVVLQYPVPGTGIPSNGYFLIANTAAVEAGGVTKIADAVYNPGAHPGLELIRVKNEAGSCGDTANDADSIGIAWAGSTDWIDRVGWRTNPGSGNHDPSLYEGTSINQTIGLQFHEQFVRKTNSASVVSGVGRAYDANNNDADFRVESNITYPPRNSLDIEAPTTGTPAAGAPVFANDGLSGSAQVAASGAFSLTSVATGYWTLYVSSGMSISTGGVYGGTTNGYSASAGSVVLSTANVFGFISGVVTNVSGSGLNDIKVAAGGRQTSTTSGGRYLLPADPGEQSVTANYLTEDINYIETSSSGVTAVLGQVTDNVDFVLQAGGKLRGWITTNGTDQLPNVPVSAFKGGVEQGNGISDSEGYFLIWGSGISTGTYEIVPQLEDGESSSPSTHTVTLVAGDTAFVGTFTVTGAMGAISGSVTAGGANITAGVLVYATTTTLTGSPIMPPTMNAATRSGTVKYYAVSSNAQGHYELPVRGGSTYNIYAWYTTWSNTDAATIAVRQSTAAVAAGETVTENFSW